MVKSTELYVPLGENGRIYCEIVIVILSLSFEINQEPENKIRNKKRYSFFKRKCRS